MARGLRKHHILYVDDKSEWRDNFQQQHGQEYDVTAVASPREFEQQLERMLAEKRLPDLVLIDLYHPRYPNDAEQQAKVNAAGEAAIARLEEEGRRAREAILTAWEPYGVTVLEQARQLLDAHGQRDVPLVIYTQQGLTIANNEELKRVSALRGEWLLKNRANAEYESYRINELIALHERRQDNYRRVYRNTSWAIAALLLILLLTFAYFHHKTSDLILSVGLSAVLVALQPVVAKLSEKAQQ